MLSSLLTQFRQRYPLGTLASDLLTIHDGQYVVRVCVGAEGVTLSCGLGANPSLEVAEDLATTRALERLGQGTMTTGASGTSTPVADVPVPLAMAVPPNRRFARPEPEPIVEQSPLAPSQISPNPSLAPVRLESGAPEEANTPAPEPKSIALAISPETRSVAARSESQSLFPADLTDDAMELGHEPGAAIDLSDIIAQTDVELQRLGWAVNQGREFLEQTYGKRSRHDLTDDELLEFLLYLETQSPSQPP